MTYRLLPSAVRDIDHIESWIASEFGQTFALDVRQEILHCCLLLARFQQMGKLRPDVTDRAFRFFCCSPNWIVYRPGDPLRVHRVIPGRMDLKAVRF